MNRIEMKKIANNLEEGEVYLLNGKKVVYLVDFTRKGNKFVLSVANIREDGLVSSKYQTVDITSVRNIIHIPSKQVMKISISNRNIRRAEKEFDSTSKEDTLGKVYIVLKVEGFEKVVVGKARDVANGKRKCYFKIDGEPIVKQIPESRVFDDRAEARDYLKSLKSSNGKAKTGKSKSFLLLNSGKILSCIILKETKNKSKIEVEVKGETVKKVVPNSRIFSSRRAAKRAATKVN